MKKFECNGCTKNCVIYRAEGGRPMYCVDCYNWADWNEVREEAVTGCDQLPKLSAEVFNHPDCPEWAKYAATDEDGMVLLFEHRPTISHHGQWWYRRHKYCRLDGRYDSSDWKNSLIERPEKEK